MAPMSSLDSSISLFSLVFKFIVKSGVLESQRNKTHKPERVVRMLVPQMVAHLPDDLSVGLGLEDVALPDQIRLHVLVVGQNPVVDDEEPVAVVRTLRVGVLRRRGAVGRPARVSNPNVNVVDLVHPELLFLLVDQRLKCFDLTIMVKKKRLTETNHEISTLIFKI